MNISIRTLLVSLLLGLPLIVGTYTYLYSINTSEARITAETHRDLLRTLTQKADNIRYFLNVQNHFQVQHEMSETGENSKIRQALIFDERMNVSDSIHIADRNRGLKQLLEQALDSEFEAVASKISSHIESHSARVTTWGSSDGKSIYGLAPIRYTKKQSAIRPDSFRYLFIQQDLTTDFAASNTLVINIIIVQFVLSLIVILLVNQFVLGRLNLLKRVATSILDNNHSQQSDKDLNEIDLLDRTLTQLASDLSDATDRIKEQNQFTLNVINSTDEGLFGIDTNGRITFANYACLRMLGYESEKQLLGKEMHSLLLHSQKNGEPYPSNQNPIQNVLSSSKKIHRDQEVFWRNDNSFIDVEYWTSPLKVNEQNTGLVITFMDITERRKAQKDLIMKDAAITNSLDGIAMGDMEGNIFYVNDAMVRMWGYESSDEIIGLNSITLWKQPEQATQVIEQLAQQKKVAAEMEGVRKDGSSFIAHLSASISADQNGQPLCLMASFIDISEQKEVEAALLRSEETYAKAEEIAHIGSWDWNILTGDLRWTDEIYRIFGQLPQSFGATYETFQETIHPDDRDIVSGAVNASVADADTPYSIEHRVVRPSGEIRSVHERGKVYRSDDGQPVRMIGTVHDITDTKEFERALRDERNFVNAILDSAGALVLVMDTDGRVLRFNRACQEITGFSLEEIVDDYIWAHLLMPEMSPIAQNMYAHPEEIPSEYTNHWITKSGGERLISWSNRPLRNEMGEIEFIVSLGIDITEKHATEKELEIHRHNLELLVEERTQELEQAQEELVRNERLATLGQLTATVSHELRNPLGAMRPSIYLIKRLASGDNDKLNDAIERIERNIARCDHIIDELLDFTRITDIEVKATPLDEFLHSILDEHLVPENIRLLNQPGLNDMEVMLDKDRLRRCIINVIDNAIQAMTEEGLESSTQPQLSISTQHENNRVCIHFDDNGPGIDEEIIDRIFEPLFSTKGFGVGLGLPTVKQIMEQHDGGIDVRSICRQGTGVTLWLPDNRIVRKRDEYASITH